MRLRLRSRWLDLHLLLTLPTLLIGCATVRPGVTPDPRIKTFASIGDRPYPVVVGPPGEAVVADRSSSERPVWTENAVSGRVVDARGKPVAGARVRLAADGTGRGRLARVETDAAGGFTLRGLRPGSTYTVIAEWEDDQGVISSRVQVEAPDDRVCIELIEEEPGGIPTYAGPRRSVDRVSDRSRSAEGDLEREPSLRISADDPEPPPPPEADRYENSNEPYSSVSTPTDPVMPARGPMTWRPTTIPEPRHSVDELEPLAISEIPRHHDPAAIPPQIGLPEEDDVPNPLPPALERPEPRPGPTPVPPIEDLPAPTSSGSGPDVRHSSAHFLPVRPEPGPRPKPAVDRLTTAPQPVDRSPTVTRPSRSIPEISHVPAPEMDRDQALSAQDRTAQPVPLSEPTLPDPPPTAPSPTTLPQKPSSIPIEPPGETEMAPSEPSPGPIESEATAAPPIMPREEPLSEPVESSPMVPTPSTETPLPPAEPVLPQPVDPPPLDDPLSPAGSEPSPDTEPTRAPSGSSSTDSSSPPEEGPLGTLPDQTDDTPRRKVTWGELTAKLRDEKPAETPKRRASALPALALLNRGNSSDHVQVAVHGGDAPRNSVRASVRTPEPLSDEQICQFDRRTNRLIDFRLPDVNGREVRFQDLDADLILLDFWGTWCPPCLESIPHLVKLQETHGPKRLKIVGIAYEQTPIEKRAASVMATAGRLGINYTLLLGRTEAPCPVRDALHVQVYPTMVLLDRHGRVLWRQEGATAQTLARLNRMVGIALQDSTRGQTTHR